MKAAVLVLCGVATAVGMAQSRTGDPQPRFRGGVELVQLDVTALDRDGMPVRGLTASDFTILEEGVVRPVASFTAVDVPDRVSAGASWVHDVAPDVASNGTDAQRVVLIVLDECDTPLDPGVVKTAKSLNPI